MVISEKNLERGGRGLLKCRIRIRH